MIGSIGYKVQYKMSCAALPPVGRRPVPSVIFPPAHTFNEACAIVGADPKLMRGDRRDRPVVRQRWHVMSVMRDWGRSLSYIGRCVNRDHTTVLYGIRRHAEGAKVAAE